MLIIFLLGAGYVCAQAQAAVTLVNLPTNRTGYFNLSSLVGGEDAGIDPRFSVGFEDLTDDLSDKSTYMSALSLMFRLSEFSFEATSCGNLWTAPGYEDIEILMEPSIPGTITLQTRFMMWGLYYTVKRMANENFLATKAYLFWDQDGQKIHVGFATIQKSSASQNPRLVKRAFDSSCRFSNASLELEEKPSTDSSATLSSAASLSPDLRPQSTKNVSEEANSFTRVNTTIVALGGGKARIRVDFEGMRLTKYGIFISTIQAMVALASFPRDWPPTMGITLGDYQSQTQLDLRASSNPQEKTPYLVYDKAMWLLWKVPIYMYGVNRFEQCTFMLLEGNVEVGRGTFKRNPYMAETAVDAA